MPNVDLDKFVERINTCSFKSFIKGPFAQGFEAVEGNKFVTWSKDSAYSFPRDLANRLADNMRTATIGPRNHTKSSIFRAFALWNMAQAKNDISILYMSYKKEAAEDHIKKARRIVEESPLLNLIFTSNTTAKTKLNYTNKNGARCTLEPIGVLNFKRGTHCNILLCDDILKDERSRKFRSGAVTPTEVEKVTERFFEEVVEIPSQQEGQLHVIGTAIHKSDALFQLMERKEWNSKRVPAVFDIEFDENGTEIIAGEPAWPEFYKSLAPFNKKLRDSNSLRIFRKEHLGEVSSDLSSFLNLDHVEGCFGFDLENRPPKGAFVGGHDIGKEVNPSHSFIFLLSDKGVLWEMEQEWMFDESYVTQARWWKQHNRKYGGFHLVFYDDSRGEFSSMYEESYLPDGMKPYPLSGNHRYAAAAALQRRIENETIRFKADDRIFEQMLNVDDQLKAPSVKGGFHSDCFWSAALACIAASKVGKTKQDIVIPDTATNPKLTKQSRWRI